MYVFEPHSCLNAETFTMLHLFLTFFLNMKCPTSKYFCVFLDLTVFIAHFSAVILDHVLCKAALLIIMLKYNSKRLL